MAAGSRQHATGEHVAGAIAGVPQFLPLHQPRRAALAGGSAARCLLPAAFRRGAWL
jgi:hypothetical protein